MTMWRLSNKTYYVYVYLLSLDITVSRWRKRKPLKLFLSFEVKHILIVIRSDQISSLFVSDSLRPNESQHARPPCPSQLPEFTQTHVYRISDAIQPSHPLSSPSPPAPNPSQHQSLFQCVNSLHEATKVLEFQLEHHSFQRNPRADLLQNGLVGSPCSPRDS